MSIRRVVSLSLLLALGAAAVHAPVPVGRYCFSEDNQVVLDRGTGLVWERDIGMGTWTEALARCENLTLGPYESGWRLPTIKELHTILDEEAEYGLDPAIFHREAGDARFFWSATPVAGVFDHVWVVAFGGEKPHPTVGGLQNGQTYRLPLSDGGTPTVHAVRCVR